jgi:hypothetical protein
MALGVSNEEKLTRSHLQGTFRTFKKNATPLDIAREFGHDHLYDILSPVIRHTVPQTILISLEKLLYSLIEQEVGAVVGHPLLIVLLPMI